MTTRSIFSPWSTNSCDDVVLWEALAFVLYHVLSKKPQPYLSEHLLVRDLTSDTEEPRSVVSRQPLIDLVVVWFGSYQRHKKPNTTNSAPTQTLHHEDSICILFGHSIDLVHVCLDQSSPTTTTTKARCYPPRLFPKLIGGCRRCGTDCNQCRTL